MAPTGIAKTVDRNAGIVLRRVPLWSLGIGFLMIIMIAGAWVMREQLVAISANSDRLRLLEDEVAHCREMKGAMQREIDWLEHENESLKDRVASLENRVAKMP